MANHSQQGRGAIIIIPPKKPPPPTNPWPWIIGFIVLAVICAGLGNDEQGGSTSSNTTSTP